MANVKVYAMIFMVIMAMTRVLAEEEETPMKVTASEVSLAAEAAASSFKSSAGEAAEGAKSWADWATSKFRRSGPSDGDLEKAPSSD